MTAPQRVDLSDGRRRRERREDVRLGELSMGELRRVVVTAVLGAVVVALFVWMVRDVLVAGLLGAIAAAYLRPLYAWLGPRTRPVPAAILALVAVFAPLIGALAYTYAQVLGVAAYVGAHEEEVMGRVTRALARAHLSGVTPEAARGWVVATAAAGTRLPGAARAAVAHGAVAVTIFAFTAVYLLTDGRAIGGQLRERLSERYMPLVDAFVVNVRGVLAGAVYGSVLAQALKSVVMLALALAFRVPLAVALAFVSFVLGFFPIVGSWSVYVPTAAWLYVFRDATAAALVVLAVGFFVNTVFISTYLRPKLAARRSRVLNFYWMFIGIVTGVYAFGLPGVVLGPALIGLLKALVDTVTGPGSWPQPIDATELEEP